MQHNLGSAEFERISDYSGVTVPRNKLRTQWLGPFHVADIANDRVYICEELKTPKCQSIHALRLTAVTFFLVLDIMMEDRSHQVAHATTSSTWPVFKSDK